MIRKILFCVFICFFPLIAYSDCYDDHICGIFPPSAPGGFATVYTTTTTWCQLWIGWAHIVWNAPGVETDIVTMECGSQTAAEVELALLYAAVVLAYQQYGLEPYSRNDAYQVVTVKDHEVTATGWLCDHPNGCDQDGDTWFGYECGGNDCSDTDPTNHPYADSDGDGYYDARCGGSDCRDDDSSIFPGAASSCTFGIDANCNGQDDGLECGGCPDADGDGYPGTYCGGTDCNDYNGMIYPGSYAAYYCQSGLDADCDGMDDGYECGSPILISTEGGKIALTSKADGVMFDLKGTGAKIQIPWTVAGSDDAWLMLDRNGNGVIDDGTELFGNVTAQPDPEPGKYCNGFSALSLYDQADNGGNGDGFIDSRDAVFSRLQLWVDRNHNGVSELSELYRLSAFGVETIDLNYEDASKRDKYGNLGLYRSKIYDSQRSHVSRWAWDIFLNLQ